MKQRNRSTGWTFLISGRLIVVSFLKKTTKHQRSESCTTGGASASEGPSRVIKPELLDGSSSIKAQSQSRSFARYLLSFFVVVFFTSRSLVLRRRLCCGMMGRRLAAVQPPHLSDCCDPPPPLLSPHTVFLQLSDCVSRSADVYPSYSCNDGLLRVDLRRE